MTTWLDGSPQVAAIDRRSSAGSTTRDRPDALGCEDSGCAGLGTFVTGGGGVWSPLAMPPNALINESEAATILKYVLSLADTNAGSLALSGTFTPKLPAGDAGRGSVIVRAVYTDQGEEQIPPLTGESVRILRSPLLSATQAEVKQQIGRAHV